ncbi:MAG: DUF1828 domain-containing protein [Desulfamplus sp.]|nr:DUF1828 domain-containing protein [Desulfamplus sp.]
MDSLLNIIKDNFNGKIDIYKRREGITQLILPIFYEDGDMVDIFIKNNCPDSENRMQILDYGMTLMKLSYTYDINSPSKERILNTILNQSGISNHEGNLYLDTSIESIYQSIMQFVGCQQKILNMRLWQRETIKSLFFEKLDDFIESHLKNFIPTKSVTPLKDYPIIEVDYSLEFSKKPFYLFGVNNKDKAKNSAIALLELQKAKLPFISIIIHENIQELPSKEQVYLTQNCDKQFPTLENFKDNGIATIERLAA